LIISKTPYRISFFGGGTDYPQWFKKNSGKIISTTIDRHIYITCRHLPKFFEHDLRIVYSIDETVKTVSQIKHNVVREAIKLFKIKKGLEIHYDGDFPSKSGMASSSTFSVGLLNCLSHYAGKKFTKKELYEKTLFLEQQILKENVGNQDQLAASYGGFNIVNFDKNGFKIKKIKNKFFLNKLENNLYLIYTGILRSADEMAKRYINKLESKKKILNKLMHHVDTAENIIKKGNTDDFGYLLDETWNEKKSIDKRISNNLIDELYIKGKKNGAIGGKLLGAGNGGFLLFYVPKKNKYKFLKCFENKICMPIKFYNHGSTIIHKN
jgi:D-glycero-alpha-D-manno-heptose-7-phosphate kinase